MQSTSLYSSPVSLYSIPFTRFTIHYLNTHIHTDTDTVTHLICRWTTASYNIIIIIIIHFVVGADDFVCFCAAMCRAWPADCWLVLMRLLPAPLPLDPAPLPSYSPGKLRHIIITVYNCSLWDRACMKSPSEKLLEQTLNQEDNTTQRESFKLNKLTEREREGKRRVKGRDMQNKQTKTGLASLSLHIKSVFPTSCPLPAYT